MLVKPLNIIGILRSNKCFHQGLFVERDKRVADTLQVWVILNVSCIAFHVKILKNELFIDLTTVVSMEKIQS